jgi:REP element-mobilizing transposase RayT
MRGIEGRELFRDDVDRRHFLDRFSEVALASGARCAAWALIPNHVHFLVRSGHVPLSAVMQRLGTSYVRFFNARHQRSGYLFQGRYKSLLVEDETYLLVLIRYVHRNPLRAGLVPSIGALGRYPWSGHAGLMGYRAEPFQLVDGVLSRFSAEIPQARKLLIEWMGDSESVGDDARPPEHTEAGEPALTVAGTPLHRDARMRVSRCQAAEYLSNFAGVGERKAEFLRRCWSLDSLIDRLCAELNADPGRVREGRRTAPESRARAAIASVAARQLGLSLAEIAPALGVSVSALSQAEARGAVIAEEAGFNLAHRDFLIS